MSDDVTNRVTEETSLMFQERGVAISHIAMRLSCHPGIADQRACHAELVSASLFIVIASPFRAWQSHTSLCGYLALATLVSGSPRRHFQKPSYLNTQLHNL